MSEGVSAIAVGTALLIVRKKSRWGVAAALIIFTLSKAFIDFSTSGLENPLTHLLLAAFLLAYLELPTGHKRTTALAVLTALILVNRMDSVLLILPALALELWENHKAQTLGRFALGLFPFFAWELFAITYYGFPFPNTVYAKLGGLSVAGLAPHGLAYLANSLSWDPITLACIITAIVLAYLSRNRIFIALGSGLVLTLFYVVAIGGDFMSGRFLAAPFFLGVILILRIPKSKSQIAFFGVMICVMGLVFAPRSPLLSPVPVAPRTLPYVVDDPTGIADEAVFYCYGTCLVNQAENLQNHPWVVDSRNLGKNGQVVVRGGIGMAGYYAGPRAKIVDPYAIADAFLARMPGQWYRPGHIVHDPPQDYLASVGSGRNEIQDPKLKSLLDSVWGITRGPLFSKGRRALILRANYLGLGDGLPLASAVLTMSTLLFWLGLLGYGGWRLGRRIFSPPYLRGN